MATASRHCNSNLEFGLFRVQCLYPKATPTVRIQEIHPCIKTYSYIEKGIVFWTLLKLLRKTFNPILPIENIFVHRWAAADSFVLKKYYLRMDISRLLVMGEKYADPLDFTTTQITKKSFRFQCWQLSFLRSWTRRRSRIKYISAFTWSVALLKHFMSRVPFWNLFQRYLEACD